MLTKSDFKLYLEAPMHLWAKSHGELDTTPSTYEQHLMEQGYAVESVAKEYLEQFVLPKYAHAELLWQPIYKSGDYNIRADGIIHDLDTDTYDLYEIKSSTKAKKEHLPDVTFQSLVIGDNVEVGKIHLVLLDKNYVRGESLDIENLFVMPDVTEDVAGMTETVRAQMKEALKVTKSESSVGIPNCLTPNKCHCMELCHPNLPSPSIYDIPHLSAKKKREFEDDQVLRLDELSLDATFTSKQQSHIDVMASNTTFVDRATIFSQFGSLSYPLYFLDYETYDEALPLYPGQKPYQKMVFQFSLHILDVPGGKYRHEEHIATTLGDPGRDTVARMREVIGDVGSVIVWNDTFEGGRNKEMAKMYPEFSEFLLGVNGRMYDLMKVVMGGYYLHPKFCGRYTIKYVLPVMAPELSYESLAIRKGDQAMIAWWEMVNGENAEKKAETADALLRYCEMDTWAMVRIWEEIGKVAAT